MCFTAALMSRPARSRRLLSKMELAPASVVNICHNARGAFRGVGAGDPQACAGAHKAVAIVVKSGKQFSDCFVEECPRGAENGFCPTNHRMHHLTILQPGRARRGVPCIIACFVNAAIAPPAIPSDVPVIGPGKYRQARYPVNDARLRRRRRDEAVGVVGRHEGVFHLEVAAAGATKPRDVPGVMNGHLLAREVTADRRLAVVAAISHGSQSHESGGMTGAAAERPAPRQRG